MPRFFALALFVAALGQSAAVAPNRMISKSGIILDDVQSKIMHQGPFNADLPNPRLRRRVLREEDELGISAQHKVNPDLPSAVTGPRGNSRSD